MLVLYKTVPFESVQSEEHKSQLVYLKNGQIFQCNNHVVELLTFCLVQRSNGEIDAFISKIIPACNESKRQEIFQLLLNLKIIRPNDDWYNIKSVKVQPSYLKNNFTLIKEKQVKRISSCFQFLFQKELAYLILSALCFQLCYHYSMALPILEQTIDVKSLLFVTAISVLFHEIGHAAACQFYGKEISRIGGGFYLFRPVMFADVSQIWSLEKTKRIKVSLSGIYFELVFVVLFFCIHFVIDSEMALFLGYLLLTQSLWNLNPLIRSDGYWIITDFLGVSNLNREGRSAWNVLLKRTNKIQFKECCVAIYFFFFKSGTLILTLIYMIHFFESGKAIFYLLLDRSNGSSFNFWDALGYKEVLTVFLFCYLVIRTLHVLYGVTNYFSRKLKTSNYD